MTKAGEWCQCQSIKDGSKWRSQSVFIVSSVKWHVESVCVFDTTVVDQDYICAFVWINYNCANNQYHSWLC